MLSVGADSTIREWDSSTGACLRVLTFDRDAAPPLPVEYAPYAFIKASSHALHVSADRRFILCSIGGRVWVLDYATGDVVRVLTGHTNSVTAVTTTPDGRYALTAGYDATHRVWDMATGRLLQTLPVHVVQQEILFSCPVRSDS